VLDLLPRSKSSLIKTALSVTISDHIDCLIGFCNAHDTRYCSESSGIRVVGSMGRISLFAGLWLVSPPHLSSLHFLLVSPRRSPWNHHESTTRSYHVFYSKTGILSRRITDTQWTFIRWSTSRSIWSKMVVPRRSIYFLYLLNHLGRHQGK
jgi:hypothetical protein